VENIYTVSELTDKIKRQLEGNFPSIALKGEVSNAKKHSSGHIYFSLKDAEAQISAVFFKGQAAKLKNALKDGDQVTVTGSLNVYPPAGRYQLIVHSLEFLGLGALLVELENLKKKLLAKGYFGKEHKKKLPFLPTRIGVITSPTGAVIQDIIHVLSRRYPNFALILNPVRVQGKGAAKEIAEAIDFFNNYKLVDVLIVGRGGGSLEDLWAFNEEIVADAIFKSTIPIIAAVGHETDHTIAEYVADVRAPTPSAAAEIVLKEKKQLTKQLLEAQEQISQKIQEQVYRLQEKLDALLKHPVLSTPYALIGPYAQKLDDLKDKADSTIKKQLESKKNLLVGVKRQHEILNPITQMAHKKKQLLSLSLQITHAIKQKIQENRNTLRQITVTFTSIDPKNILKKGYALVFAEKNGSIVTSTKDLKKDALIRLQFKDGSVTSQIQEICTHA
jgi:exodeoxyribonuclease VII large subunit